jgi:competence protein ComEC
MPLVAWGALAYALGLFVALATSSVVATWTAACALAAAAFGMRARGAIVGACGVLIAAGVLAGLAAVRDDARCAQALVHDHQWGVSLEHAAHAGDVAHGTLRRDGCSAPATLLVVHGSADAGDVATIRGTAAAGDRGVFVRDVEILSTTRGPLGVRLRARAGARIDRVFAGDAPIVRALVIADMSAIPAEQRDRFARAGLVHMLSVSGLHVAVIALALELLASALRLPMRPARIASLALLAAYVAAIGAPPPAVRAAAMLAVLLGSRLAQRPTSAWAVLALGGVLPLVDPRVVVDLGWQLSVAGTIALVAGAALAARSLPPAWRGARRALARAVIVSIVATVVTAPLVAWSFGRIALLGPITNLLADPLMGIVQPLLFAALCIPIAAVEHGAADAAHLLLAGFDGIATVASSVPGAAPIVLPTVLGACAAGAGALATVVACVAHRWVGAVLVALGCIGIMLVEPALTLDRAMTELHVIDVGQGTRSRFAPGAITGWSSTRAAAGRPATPAAASSSHTSRTAAGQCRCSCCRIPMPTTSAGPRRCLRLCTPPVFSIPATWARRRHIFRRSPRRASKAFPGTASVPATRSSSTKR